ncbi:hypothetical protein NCC49_004533 [Naganishia albida]|nr:hypothetical protein NCC49_004533 [Naganishia albida]
MSDEIRKRSRVKTGCLICRRRRVKCDEGKPKCGGCLRVGGECQYPEPIRLPWEASSSKSPAQQSTSPKPNASLLSLVSEVDTRLAEIEHDLPEVKAYYAYKGYDQSSEQATTVAFMSALLRDTKVARYFFGGEEPWVVLRDLVDGDVELRCISHAINYTLSLLVIDEQNNSWLNVILYILLVKRTQLPRTAAALKIILLQLGAAHVAYLQRETDFITGLEHCHLFTGYRHTASRRLREMLDDPMERREPEAMIVVVLQLGADMLTLNPAYRETLRMAYRCMRDQGGPQRILEKFNVSLGEVEPAVEMQLRISVRCAVQTLYIFDVFAALGEGRSPFLAFQFAEWWRADEGRDSVSPTQKIIGIDAELAMLFARVTSCVARRRQYQLHYGTIDFNHPPDQLGTWIPAFDGQEHHAATQSLIECVKGVTEDLARWKVGPALGGHDARAEVYWHACRLLLLRHVYRRFAEDTQCQQSAVAVLQLCEAMADGKIEYLNWPIIIASSIFDSSQTDLRRRTTDLFQKFSYQRCFDLFGSRTVVEEMWKRIDAGRDYDACFWVEVMAETGQSCLLG